MRNIISVEYEIPGFSDGLKYSSDQSLLDVDIIVFQPERFSTDYGKPSFDESSSFELQRSTEHWRTELGIALKYGKTVFLILGKYQVASIYTGRKESKGRVQVNYVREYSNYEFLPVSLPTITAKKGTEIVFTGDPVFATFWNEFNEYLTYESYFNEKVRRPVFITKTGERPIGAMFKVEKGHFVSLPLMNYSERKLSRNGKMESSIGLHRH